MQHRIQTLGSEILAMEYHAQIFDPGSYAPFNTWGTKKEMYDCRGRYVMKPKGLSALVLLPILPTGYFVHPDSWSMGPQHNRDGLWVRVLQCSSFPCGRARQGVKGYVCTPRPGNSTALAVLTCIEALLGTFPAFWRQCGSMRILPMLCGSVEQ